MEADAVHLKLPCSTRCCLLRRPEFQTRLRKPVGPSYTRKSLDWPKMGDPQQVPTFTPQQEFGEINSGDHEGDRQAVYGNKSAPRLLYGSTSRFGMVKGSIAARKATAAAAAASKARRIPTTSSTATTATTATTPVLATINPPPPTTSEYNQQPCINNLEVCAEEDGPSASASVDGGDVFEADEEE